MLKKYKNLISAISNFSLSLELDVIESLSMLKRAIENKLVSYENLTNEYKQAMADLSFDWIELAYKTELLFNIDMKFYENKDIKVYVQSLLEDFLFPDKVRLYLNNKLLNTEVENILKPYKLNDGWMKTFDLFKILKKKEGLGKLEFYDVYVLNITNNIIMRDYNYFEGIKIFIKYQKA